MRDFVHSKLQHCYSSQYNDKLVQSLVDRTSYATMNTCGTRITQFGFDKYIYDSLINQIAHPNMITQLGVCDIDTLLYAAGHYNIRQLITAIASNSPSGTNYLNSACSTFSITYPNPGLGCHNYLAQIVPLDSLLAHIRANYTGFVADVANHYSQEQMLEMISQYYPVCDFKTCMWNKVNDGTLAFDSSTLIQYTHDNYWPYLTRKLYECNADTFTLHAAYTRPHVITKLFEDWHYPLADFMTEVETHYNSTVRNLLDVDTFKKVQYLWVNEWHMYGSSRLGVYQAQNDTVRGVVRNYDHRVSNDTVSTAYFSIDTLHYNKFAKDSIHYLHKGLKQYEGTNHLGNVLAVFTDKRIKVCTNDTIHYYRADVVNAYEYSPFGAPMRRWGLPKYAVKCDSVFVITITPDSPPPIFELTVSSNTGLLFSNLFCVTGQGYECDNEFTTLSQGMDSLVKWLNDINGLKVRKDGYTLIIEANRCEYDTLTISVNTGVGQTITRNWRVTPTGPDNYRFGFNGKEKDLEGMGGGGTTYDYGFRIYNPNLGKFLSVDPLTSSYPTLTPYQFASNTPIWAIDLDGLEGVDANYNIFISQEGKSVFTPENSEESTIKISFFEIGNNGRYFVHSFNGSPTLAGLIPDNALRDGQLFRKYWLSHSWTDILRMKTFSDKIHSWEGFNENLVKKLGLPLGSEPRKSGFMNTFVHQIWQSTLTIVLGEEFAKDMGDSWESKRIKSKGWTKESAIDLINNYYGRQYGKKFNLTEITKDIDAFTAYLNNFAQHLASTSDGIKDDKRFEKLRTGEVKLFDKNDALVQELYKELKSIADKPDDL